MMTLAEYEAKQVALYLRAEAIEQKAKYLMQPGQEYDPWKFENFMEAMENAPEAMQKTVHMFIGTAVGSHLKNDHSNHLALAGIKQMVEDYWFEAAKRLVERDFD